jgi:hypothetical protein
VEALRERLQRQTDIATRAEVALQSLALSAGREAGELRSQLEELRLELGAQGEARRNLAAEAERLRAERLGLQSGRVELGGEVERLRAELAEAKDTLARQASCGAERGGGGRVAVPAGRAAMCTGVPRVRVRCLWPEAACACEVPLA